MRKDKAFMSIFRNDHITLRRLQRLPYYIFAENKINNFFIDDNAGYKLKGNLSISLKNGNPIRLKILGDEFFVQYENENAIIVTHILITTNTEQEYSFDVIMSAQHKHVIKENLRVATFSVEINENAKELFIEFNEEDKDNSALHRDAASLLAMTYAIAEKMDKGYQAVRVMQKRTQKQKLEDAKTAKKRPELRQDLPHIIFLDPEAPLKIYEKSGHTSQPAAKKSPHGRRGHWRVLGRDEDFEKKIWVKPTWVGPKSWEDLGQTYFILP